MAIQPIPPAPGERDSGIGGFPRGTRDMSIPPPTDRAGYVGFLVQSGVEPEAAHGMADLQFPEIPREPRSAQQILGIIARTGTQSQKTSPNGKLGVPKNVWEQRSEILSNGNRKTTDPIPVDSEVLDQLAEQKYADLRRQLRDIGK